MNVAFDPWIPVVNSDGRRVLVSLSDVFINGHEYPDLCVRPHERVSLMRLFICIAHASLNGPKNYDEWLKVPELLQEAAKNYLEKWKDSFELFHPERPWLQVAKLEKVNEETRITYLDPALSTGNNSMLFDHYGLDYRDIYSQEYLPLNLLTFQNFSSGGGSPIAKWNEYKTSQVGNPDAPCLSQSMFHAFFRANSIFKTVHLNLPTYETIFRKYKIIIEEKGKTEEFKDISLGSPVWEDFPKSPDVNSLSVINATKTYLGRLVPISRWILLNENSCFMLCSNGFKYETFREGFPSEPTASVELVTRNKNIERELLKANSSKSPWRQLASILVERKANSLGGPLAIDNMPLLDSFDFHLCGMVRDQASMDSAVESVFHISEVFRENIEQYAIEVNWLENLAKKISWAIEIYRINVDKDWTGRMERTQAKNRFMLRYKLCEPALLAFWTFSEKRLPKLFAYINSIGTDEANVLHSLWRNDIFRSALSSYSLVCAKETPRQMKAFVLGYKKLTGSNNKKTKSKKEEDVILDGENV